MKVPVKEISEVQKHFGQHLLIIPKVKCVVAIEGDQSRKCILLKNDTDIKSIEDFIKERGFEVSEEKVTLSYDNLSMSKRDVC